jgi:hypothetical protein
MVQKTRNYKMFKFREDNRAVNPGHLRNITESIRAKNMLEVRPILVNEKMEVIDGQNRLKAAEALGVEIYYEVKKDIQPEDMLILNISKSWGIGDFFNYWLKNGNPEYIKLNKFMHEHGINLKITLPLVIGQTHEKMDDFKKGKFIYNTLDIDKEFDICKDTIALIKKVQGFSAYTGGPRFWKALLKVIKHPNFDAVKWMNNLEKLIGKMGPRANEKMYVELFCSIYNWGRGSRINFSQDGEME